MSVQENIEIEDDRYLVHTHHSVPAMTVENFIVSARQVGAGPTSRLVVTDTETNEQSYVAGVGLLPDGELDLDVQADTEWGWGTAEEVQRWFTSDHEVWHTRHCDLTYNVLETLREHDVTIPAHWGSGLVGNLGDDLWEWMRGNVCPEHDCDWGDCEVSKQIWDDAEGSKGNVKEINEWIAARVVRDKS